MIYVLQVLVSGGTLLLQIINLKRVLDLRKLIGNQGMDKQKPKYEEQENSCLEIDEWVERFIDDYLSDR